jgi:hypothetical protein
MAQAPRTNPTPAAQTAPKSNAPVDPAPASAATTPGTGAPASGQTLPSAPVAPAVKAAKAKKELTPEQTALKAKIAEMQREFNQMTGKVTKAKTTAGGAIGGFSGTEQITAVEGVTLKDAEKQVIGKTLRQAADAIGYGAVRPLIARGKVKLDGFTLTQAFAKAAGKPAAAPQPDSTPPNPQADQAAASA